MCEKYFGGTVHNVAGTEAIDTELETMVNELTAKVTADMGQPDHPQAPGWRSLRSSSVPTSTSTRPLLALARTRPARPVWRVLLPPHLCEALRVCGILLEHLPAHHRTQMMEQLGLDASALTWPRPPTAYSETYTVHRARHCSPASM